MATLIKADGTRTEIQPKNGTNFKLEELQEYVDGYIEIVNLRNGEILVINEDGKDRTTPTRLQRSWHTSTTLCFLVITLMVMWYFVKMRRYNNGRNSKKNGTFYAW